jgi:menaquinone-dependent protoporphyrinogen IX oxidase
LGKALVVYESVFGNTEKLARALAQGLEQGGVNAECVQVDVVKFDELKGYDLLVVGGPVHGWNVSKPVKGFLERLKSVEGLSGKKAFSFDTKMSRSRLAGDAGGKVERKLKGLGLTILKAHASAVVKGREGPLEAGAEETFKQLGADLAKMI